MSTEHVLGCWAKLGTYDLEIVTLAGPAGLADERQRRDDGGGWWYVGELPCDCEGCTGQVTYV